MLDFQLIKISLYNGKIVQAIFERNLNFDAKDVLIKQLS